MTENELAKRAVTCRRWRWMPGMLTLEEIIPPAITLGWDEARIINSDPGEDARVCTVLGRVRDIHATALPDLTDPATLGCILHLVREAWNQPHAAAAMGGFGWAVYSFVTNGIVGDEPAINGRYGDGYTTEAEALVAALEAAP